METNEPSRIDILPTGTNDPRHNRFVSQLSQQHLRALSIARDHLKTSFDLESSNGFVDWTVLNPK